MSEISTKPYLLRAIYEWCSDNGFTPYISVKVGGAVRVPMEFVRKGEIVLNVGFTATSGLKMDNEAVTFKARFGGVSRELYVPIANVQAIFASENGQGMVFDEVFVEDMTAPELSPESITSAKPVLGLAAVVSREDVVSADSVKIEDSEKNQKKPEKPSLKIIK